jgi:hypothetical protein
MRDHPFAALRLAPALRGLSVLVGIGSLVACGPTRTLVPEDATPPPTPDVVETRDVVELPQDAAPDVTSRPDAARPMDASVDAAAVCDPDRCFDECVAMGGVTGRCMMNVCSCRFPDGGAPPPPVDGGLRDGSSTLVDVVRESSVRGCMSNAECPPTMFCSAPSCSGPGQCLLRQESDPNRCVPDPAPSCGCDGLFYPSACARTVLGVRQDPMRTCSGDAAVIPASDASARD